MTTVVFHNADYDGIFCREIARKFIPDAKLIGWNFGDDKIPIPPYPNQVYVMDLPLDCLEDGELGTRVIWIDHHKTSIEKCCGTTLPGYRIDGVAACRLAWQWFTTKWGLMPPGFVSFTKEMFLERKVSEPLAVRLAGEYDVWDHRGDGDLEFQYGLRTEEPDIQWNDLLDRYPTYTEGIIVQGKKSMRYAKNMDAMWLSESWHIIQWEGLKLLAQNSVQRGSGILESKDTPEAGHDALMLYGFRGKFWTVSLYHAKHRTDLDLSEIAKKYGGGGHKGACGFTCKTLPWMANEAVEKGDAA